MTSEPSRHTLQYPIGALKGIIFGDRADEAAKQAVSEVILAKHYVSPIRSDFYFSEAAMRPDGSMCRTFYDPYVNWRHDFVYPKKGP